MLTFISCAKTMAKEYKGQNNATIPQFIKEAEHIVIQMMNYSADELSEMLNINSKIAAENYLRYQRFFDPSTLSYPALYGYTGAVFKRINANDFSSEELTFAQDHLLITSFLYGLLRPLDAIKPYRLEGRVCLPGNNHQSLFDYWKPLLTKPFLKRIKEQGGTLVNLASDEMKDLFYWPQIEKETKVITPEFKVLKGNDLKTVVMYAKMCRGEMTRFIIKNQIENPEELKTFEWEGFQYSEAHSSPTQMTFVAQ